MKFLFLEKFGFIKSFFYPFWILIVWPVIFGFSFFIPQSEIFLQKILEITITIFVLFLVIWHLLCIIYFVRVKKYSSASGLLLGLIFTIILMFFEVIILFSIGISGGATG